MGLKLGVQEKKWKVYAAAVLGLGVVGAVIYDLHDSSPAPAPPAVTQATNHPATPTPTSKTSHEATKVAAPVNLDPTLHPELMAQAESLEYTGNGRNIFSLTSVPVEIPKPVKTPRNTEQASIPTGPPPPAPPPPIDLKFFGYSARQSGVRRAFLLKGDDVFIASE